MIVKEGNGVRALYVGGLSNLVRESVRARATRTLLSQRVETNDWPLRAKRPAQNALLRALYFRANDPRLATLAFFTPCVGVCVGV